MDRALEDGVGGGGVQLHSFLILGINEGKWPVSRLDRSSGKSAPAMSILQEAE